jgi:two-component sensor histidine kinase
MNLDYSPVPGESGRPAGVLAIVVETTQRVLTERALAKTEERLRQALNASGMVGTFDWHVQSDIFFSDARFAEMFSVDPEKGEKGAPLAEYLAGIHPEDAERIARAVNHSVATGEKYVQEYRLLQQKNGNTRWVEARGECLYGEQGKPVRFVGVVVDITNQKNAQERQRLLAREADHRVKNIFANFHSMINLSARSARTPQEMAQALRGRLDALLRAKDLVRPGVMGTEHQSAADINPTPPKSVPSPAAEQAAATVADRIRDVVVPESNDNLHPRIQAWIVGHKKRQKEREQENRSRRREIGWAPPLIPDLTERDLYRFRATSAIFYAVEKASGAIEKSPTSGKVTFLIDGHQVECSIVEKMVQSLKQWEEQRKWTAFTEYCKSGLDSSGFLRISITTYLQGGRPEWVESQKIKIAQLLPTIVGAIMAAGPALEEMKREREEQQKRHREEETRRYEVRRLREIDEKRWNKFREYAVNWEERERLLAFLTEVEGRLATEGNITVSDRTLKEWVEWAKAKAEALNPFGAGAAGMFQTIARVTQWS